MDDLSGSSGLPLWLDADKETLVLAQPGEVLMSEPQPLQLLRRVLLDPSAFSPVPLYWYYPNVTLPTDEGVFQEHGVRHSLLLLRQGCVGPEYTKTRGHIQVCADGLQCPEVYGVVHGRALFLLQRQADQPAELLGGIRVMDVRWIEAQMGQKVVVPASYGVVIINPGTEPLVLSQLAAIQASPMYEVYEAMHGAAYYVIGQDGGTVAEPNRRYAWPLPPIHGEPPLRAAELGITEEMPLYSAFVHNPEHFDWLAEGVPAIAGVG